MSAKMVAVFVIAGVIGSFTLLRSCVTKVDIDKVGVRVVQYDFPGMKKGVEEKDYPAGWGWDLGPLHTWVLFDRTVHTLEMAVGEAEEGTLQAKPIKPRSSDGYELEVEVTVKYRIRPGHAHKVFRKFGANEQRFHEQVRLLAEGSIRDVFGNLKTEDFYNPDVKRGRAKAAREKLTEDVEKQGMAIEVIDVLIRNVTFPPEYESRILAKKVADQDVEYQRSAKAATTVRLEADRVLAETSAKVGIIEKTLAAEKARRMADNEKKIAEMLATADAYATTARADADLIATKRSAEGWRLMKEAEAAGVRSKNEAMSGAGGRMLVALEAVKNLDIASAEVSTALIDFLDVETMLRKLGLPSLADLDADQARKAGTAPK